MIIQKYVDCKICGERFAVCYVDDERKEITFYPMDYIDEHSGTTKIQELHVKQELDRKKHEKIVIIQCPWCGNFSINNIPYDWRVEDGFIEILNSIPSSGVETIEHVKKMSNIKGDFE